MKSPSQKNRFALSALVMGMLGSIAPQAMADPGFTEPHVTLYGRVRQQDGSQTALLRAGEIKMTLRRADQPANEVEVKGSLRQTGDYSYAMKVPLKYLPEDYQMQSHLSVGSTAKNFQVSSVTINNEPVTLEDGSQEFLQLNMADRGRELRLDLALAAPFVDSDNDGMADGWERRFNLLVGSDDSLSDVDLDGWNALTEFLNGTDPTVDNREVSLVSGESEIPERGIAGLYLDIIDSNSAKEEIQVTLDASALAGEGELLLDGLSVDLTSPLALTAADFAAGRVTVRQDSPWQNPISLSVTLQDPDRAEVVTVSRLLTTGSLVPADRRDATLWLDAASLLANQGPLATWADRSGFSQAVMQANPAYQPTIVTHESGHPTLDFSDSRAHLFLPADTFAAAQQTIFLSAEFSKTRGKSEVRTLWSTSHSSAELAARVAMTSHPDAVTFSHAERQVTSWAGAGGSLTTFSVGEGSQPSLQSQWDAASSSPSTVTRENVFPALGLERPLGGSIEDAGATAFDGLVNELLVFPRELAEQEKRRVQNFLLSKWSGAEVWDFGKEVRPHTLTSSGSNTSRLIRGGWGSDDLSGGAAADVLSGGANDDRLIGGAGGDVFLFGLLDTGADLVGDFNPDEDVLDFSNLFVGETGNVLDAISLDYSYDLSGAEPVIDTVMTLTRPDGQPLSVTLANRYVQQDELIIWLVEGSVNMGSLQVPQDLSLSVNGSSSMVEGEAGISLTLTRSGAGTAGRIEVPVALLVDSDDSREFVIPGALQPLGDRAIVVMERGESEVSFELQAINDGIAEGSESWQLAPVASHLWNIESDSVALQINEASASFRLAASSSVLNDETGEAAEIVIERLDDGSGEETLQILTRSNLATAAWSGIPEMVTFGNGELSKTFTVTPGVIDRRGVLLIGLQGEDGAQVLSPDEVRLSLLPDADSSSGVLYGESGSASPSQSVASMHEHIHGPNQQVGLARNGAGDLMLKIEDGHSVLMPRMNPAASDVKWTFETTSTFDRWDSVSAQFVEGEYDQESGRGRFVNQTPLAELAKQFYRSRAEILAPLPRMLPLAGGAITVSGMAHSGEAGSTWRSRPDGALYQTTSGADGSLILTLTGDGQLRFNVGLSSDVSEPAEIIVDGVTVQTLASGTESEVAVDVVPGVNATIELKSRGGLIIDHLTILPPVASE